MKHLLLYILLFSTVNCWAQSLNSPAKQKLIISHVTIQKSGLISWTTMNEKPDTKFVIEEFRWVKWDTIAEQRGKGIGNNSYTYLADTTCGLYKVRIHAGKDTSLTESYPDPVLVKYKGGATKPYIKFSHKTKFILYDQLGNKILSGCDVWIDLKPFKKGLYYLSYGNVLGDILKY